MKKNLVVYLLFAVLILSLSLAACNGLTPTTEYQSDANGHRPKGSDVSNTEPHTWDGGNVTLPATSAAEGIMEYTCVICGFKRAESIPKKHTHTYGEWQYDKTEHWRNTTCDHATEEGDRGAHTWDEGVISVKPTILKEGEMMYTCTICSYKIIELIPKANPINIAVVLDAGELNDGGFNQGTWEGAKEYADANGKVAKYYSPDNGLNATDTDRIQAMKDAIADGANVIVTPGFLQETAIRKVANKNPDVKFIFIDGYPVTAEMSSSTILQNVAGISFKEQEAGFLAGYAAVKDGYTNLGGTFAGGGTNPSCNRYANGYILGAKMAAKEMNKTVEMKISFKYGNIFSASPELNNQMNDWYANGTEIVFSAGGSMVKSVIAAAVANNGKVIGADVDQSTLDDCVVTSAIKQLGNSVKWALDMFYADEWDKIGGTGAQLSAVEDCVGLPTNSGAWKFQTFTVAQYRTLYQRLKSGQIKVNVSSYDEALTWVEALSESGVINVILDK